MNKKRNEPLNIAAKPIRIGLIVSLLLFGTSFIWSITAKISSASIANGKIVLNSNKKKIQHLEGGIIDEIFVSDGQIVEKGQKLIKLNEAFAKTSQEVLEKQLFSLKASKIRLEAERLHEKNPDFSSLQHKYMNDPEIMKILEGEKNLFLIRKKSLQERIDIFGQKVGQLKNEANGLISQKKSISERINLTTNERSSLYKLYKEGIISKSRYFELKKQISELKGSRGEYLANISKTKQKINEAELEIINIKTENTNQVTKELQEIQTKIADLEEKTNSSSDILQRTLITAPQGGIVNGLKFHTKGGVIAPGGEVMEIIPQDDELISEVKVNPEDIDVVKVGLEAKVRLSAYKSKKVPMLNGVVINVSGDSIQDQMNGTSYFLAKIKIDAVELKKVEGIKLYPGMPVESYILTGQRTFLQYIFDPISLSMYNAFREE